MNVRSLLALPLLFLLGACDDRLPTVSDPAETAAQSAAYQRNQHPAVQERFGLESRVSGSLRPNQPITIVTDVHALVTSPSASIEVVAPEIESARETGWGDTFRHVTDKQFPKLHQESRSLAAGARTQVRTTFKVPAAGYYRVVVTARQEGDLLDRTGRIVQDVHHQEIWLLVDETGGRVTRHFDATLLPPDVHPRPGPLVTRKRRQDDSSSDAQAWSSCATCQWSGWLGYYNADAGMNVGMPGFEVQQTFQRTSSGSGYSDYNAYRTDAHGNFYYACDNDYSQITFGASAQNSVVNITGDFPTTTQYSGATCFVFPQDLQIFLPSAPAHVALHLTATSAGLTQFFGWQAGRGRVGFELKNGNWNDMRASYFNMYQDQIEMIEPKVWGRAGLTTMAHEYGHAFHHGLGTLDVLYPVEAGFTQIEVESSCLNHNFYEPESKKCALMEGLAHYFGVIGRGTASAKYGPVYNGYPQPNGYTIEGSIAGFLHDLTRSVMPGRHLLTALKQCRNTGGQGDITSVEPLVYCLENGTYGNSWIDGTWYTDRSLLQSDPDFAFPNAADVHSRARWHLRGM